MNNFKSGQVLDTIDSTNSANVPALTEVEIFSYMVPHRTLVELVEFGNYVADVGAWGNLEWRIKQNGVLHPRVGPIKDQIGTQSQLRHMKYGIILRGGERLSISVYNSGGVQYAAGASIQLEMREP